MTSIDRLLHSDHPLALEVTTLARAVAEHALFDELRSVQDIRLFMTHHVWAVWDFMTLLKSLQTQLAPTTIPWQPPADRHAARLINELVLGEESDVGPDGEPASHFELYWKAMRSAGADDGPIARFVELLRRGVSPLRALGEAGAPEPCVHFVRTTFTAANASLPYLLAAFTIGREEIIPSMFQSLVAGLAAGQPDCPLGGLLWYLERHIAVDSGEHGPLAAALLDRLAFTSPLASDQALLGARDALSARLTLWDSVLGALSVRSDAGGASAAAL